MRRAIAPSSCIEAGARATKRSSGRRRNAELGFLLHSTAVTVRMPELGVRMALGATRVDVVRMIVRDGLIVVASGVLLGVPCALAAGRRVQAQLYGLAANDAVTLIVGDGLRRSRPW